VDVGSAVLGSARSLLHELTRSFRNFNVREVLERIGDGRESGLDGVQHGLSVERIGHGHLHPQGLSYGSSPSEMARGKMVMPKP
jgi:hypothetical protein